LPPTRSSFTIEDNANRRIEPHKAGGVMAVRDVPGDTSRRRAALTICPAGARIKKYQI
jgi:hypothetical protein